MTGIGVAFERALEQLHPDSRARQNGALPRTTADSTDYSWKGAEGKGMLHLWELVMLSMTYYARNNHKQQM